MLRSADSEAAQPAECAIEIEVETADAAFDRLVVTAILAKAVGECAGRGGDLGQRLGLGGDALAGLLRNYAPHVLTLAGADVEPRDETDEQGWVRDLLLRNASQDRSVTRALASMIARRAMEANHLWEDLGLPDRPTLGRLMSRHFGPLAARNIHNMRWKRFFYRTLCEEEGVVHCTSPVCSACADVDMCFDTSAAEASIARAKPAPR
jgi:nitrogen fixation protein NifQ